MFHVDGGRVHFRLDWSNGTELFLYIADADGNQVFWGHQSDGEIGISRRLDEGDYTVRVGEWSDTRTPFTVTIED